MRDFGEYLQAYRAYVLANLGWGKALSVALVWLAGMFAPLVAKTLFELPNWVAMTWMIVWALLGYVFAPYGMWKHHHRDCEPQSARPKIAAIVEVQDVRLYREYCIRSWESQSIPPDRFGPCAGTPNSDTITC